ncbi:hypothetical protein JCM3765_002713 [Sporobolomyces pararoseus]
MATASPHLLSGLGKQWSPPQFSKDERRRKLDRQTSFTAPLLSYFPPAGQHPDEEKGRSIRSITRIPSGSQSTGLAPGLDFSSGLSDDSEGFLDAYMNDRGRVQEEQEEDNETVVEVERLGSAFGDFRLPKEEEVLPVPQTTDRKSEAETWSEALEEAVFQTKGNLGLSHKQLTFVPDSISELSNLRKLPPSPYRPLERNTQFQSSPSLFSSPSSPSTSRSPAPIGKSPRTFNRVSSSPSVRAPVATAVLLDIDLAGNLLTANSLSNSLFGLDNLRHLWLRQNKLDRLPPGIGRLTNLNGLSLAGNQLDHLPSEILQLENLANLTLFPNPFLPPPATNSSASTRESEKASSSSSSRLLGPLVTNFTVPSLREVALRKLLEFDPSHPSQRIIQRWDSISVRDSLPAHDWAVFSSTFPSSSSLNISTRSDFARSRHASSSSTHSQDTPPALPAQPFDPLANVCRSPFHPEEEKVFLQPAVERFEWIEESLLKPRAIDLKGGGSKTIPLKWRGCGPRCLDWLEEEVVVEEEEQEPTSE